MAVSGHVHADELNLVSIDCDVQELPNYQTRDDRIRPRSVTGNGKRAEYSYKFEKDGSKHLEKIGETNVYEMIQVDKDSCDINKIIERFKAGDDSALNKVKGLYFDSTEMPSTYAEFLQAQSDGKKLFDRLPIKVKELFNNNVDEFWSTFGSPTWAKKLDILAKEVEQTVENNPSVQPFEKQVKENNMAETSPAVESEVK